MGGADETASTSSHNNVVTAKQRAARKQKRREAKEASASTLFPSSVVCTPQGLSTSKNSIELGLVFSMMIVGLYLYGFWESIQSLPDIETGRMLGANLNIPNMVHEGSSSAAARHGGDKNSALQDAVNGNNMAHQQQQHVERLGQQLPQQQQQQQQRHPAAAVGGSPPVVPTGIWPVRFEEERTNNEFETIIHPGDNKTPMSVPKFWSPPLHNNQQYTRENAMKVGTCIEPDPVTGSYQRGDKCPLDKRTIFIAIASYRDFQCRYTVESAFFRAKHPERIRVGVVDQIIDGEDDVCNAPIKPCEEDPKQALCQDRWRQQIDVYQVDAPLSIGPVFARHLGHRMYRGEYYATQSDAHVTYTQNWDEDIIQQLESTHNDMAVLSTYLTDIQGSIDPETGASLRHTRPIMCNTHYEGGVQGTHLRHGSQPERRPGISGMPQLQPWWAAGYSFSRGHFVVNVPYDPLQPMIFQGEEMSIGIRGYTIGYDFYAPERSVCFHHYATGKNSQIRNKVKHFWENGSLYAGTGVKAMARLLGIVHMNPEVDPATWDHTEEDIYGLGGVRTPEQFYKIFGINVVDKTTEGHLCMFVDGNGRMHKEFTPHLRKDGMGIDYSQIHAAWVDPNPDLKGLGA